MIKLERIIYTSPPLSFFIKKSRKLVLPGFEQLYLYDVMQVFFKQLNKIGIIERAAAISFHLVMALPATILFLFSVIPYFPNSDSFETQILDLFKDISPNSATYAFIRNLLKGLLERHVGVFSFGFVLLMYYASNAMIGIIRSFDRSIHENKNYFLHRRIRAIKLTAILIVLVLASATLLIGKDELAIILKQLFHMRKRAHIPWWNSVRWIILLGFLFYGIGIIYKFAPSVKKRWNLVSPGAVFATILTLLTAIIFSYWVNHFARFDKVYGSIGTVLVIMLLIHFNSLILLIGFELNVSIVQLKAEKEAEKLEKAPPTTIETTTTVTTQRTKMV